MSTIDSRTCLLVDSAAHRAFGDLKQRLVRQRCFELQRGYYCAQLLIWAVGLLGCAAAMWFVDGLLWGAPLAVLLAFCQVQLGFVAHDLGHDQVFHSKRVNRWVGILVATLCLGMSMRWWRKKHNEHHANPNALDLDPDLDVPFLAFSQRDAARAAGFRRWVIRRQAALFIPLTSLITFGMRWKSVRAVGACGSVRDLIELLLLGLHVLAWVTLFVQPLGLGTGLLLLLLNQAALGVYLGLSFATNHKGMPMIAETGAKPDFVTHQILTSRNLRPHPLIDLLFGPLGAQIEHHLFPHMPRPGLRPAARAVRDYCRRHQLPYHETGVRQALREVFSHLAAVGRSVASP